ncbi:hypothetical protein GCM10010306_056390 [Streptomyces umbrinus]|nr:hypothetical protein GCM10010306_056390 [Streptomyces umbrinus]
MTTPFESLPSECDSVALHELVQAATVELPLKDRLPEDFPSVTLATVLPMAWHGPRRDDGSRPAQRHGVSTSVATSTTPTSAP